MPTTQKEKLLRWSPCDVAVRTGNGSQLEVRIGIPMGLFASIWNQGI